MKMHKMLLAPVYIIAFATPAWANPLIRNESYAEEISRLKCINFADGNSVVLHGEVIQSATIEENDDDGPPHSFLALIINDPACRRSANEKPIPFMDLSPATQVPAYWLGHHVAITGTLVDGQYLGIEIKSIVDIK
jgi:hypothetical protein